MNSKKVNKLLNKTIILLLIFIVSLYAKKYVEESYSYQETGTSTASNLEIYFFDVGQADAILLKHNDDVVLIDAGNNADGEKIVDFLDNELRIDDIDILFATHPHEDHVGGLDDVIEYFEIGKIYMPDVISTSKTFEDVLNVIEDKDYSLTVPVIDSNIELGNLNIKVFYTGTDEEDLNNKNI